MEMPKCPACQGWNHLNPRFEIVKCQHCGANILTRTGELTDREPPEPNFVAITLGVLMALAIIAVTIWLSTS